VTVAQIWEFLQAGGLPAALFVFIWAGLTKRIRYGYQFDELQQERERERTELIRDRDRWRDIALGGTHLAGQLAPLVPPASERST
jgi:hypothetical protein